MIKPRAFLLTASLLILASCGGSNENQAPTAAFTVACTDYTCLFTDRSTDDRGVKSVQWDFGDGTTPPRTTSPGVATAFTFPKSGVYTVKMTVTDNGGATATSTAQVEVLPTATTSFDLPTRATVTVTLVSASCVAQNNSFVVTAPVNQTVFDNGCSLPIGSTFRLNNGAAFSAGTKLTIELHSGVFEGGAPQLRISGDFANGWTVNFDDGYLVSPIEPDFDDLVFLVKANPVQ